jgi:hypothetical protein
MDSHWIGCRLSHPVINTAVLGAYAAIARLQIVVTLPNI